MAYLVRVGRTTTSGKGLKSLRVGRPHSFANLRVSRGPNLGPLGPELLGGDGCHLSALGIEFTGQQLVNFWDF